MSDKPVRHRYYLGVPVTYMTSRLLGAQLAVAAAVTGMLDRAREERGQGSIEYVGVIAVVAAIVGAVLLVATDVGDAIGSKLTEVVNSFSA